MTAINVASRLHNNHQVLLSAVVLHSSTSNDFVVHESSPEVSHGRGGDSGIEAKITTEDENVKTELPQKANSGPLSKDIGRL
ncbi:hypothetical protein FRX31_020096 [Thalictrum thalictroides]|uniref:Uncharacterized protein n=1 Tax=Thalictrum thalictroides TaxID=46969 RepID=A0A7J6VYW0_THATH|nr:hypothetical protein FRX31_020096 [Thalictrum thalictroides]